MNKKKIFQKYEHYINDRDVKFDRLVFEIHCETKLPFWMIYQQLLYFVFDNSVLLKQFKEQLIEISKRRGN